ncbi:MAG TPA: Rieske 2Fe-2S domain-containing protein [Myxococcales bacterium]|nr:Rieske 2Fe-2S domain-containing protein [Myxococcales bacterium]
MPRDAGDGGSDGGDCPASDDRGACPAGSCAVDANTLILALADHPELVPVLGAGPIDYTCDPACGQPGTPFANESPQNGQGWGVYCDDRYSDPYCEQNAVIVLHTSASTYVALSGSCTHMCCTVGLSSDGSGLFCPCHSSFYNLQGQVQPNSAAVHNLPSLPVCFDGCAVYVQLAPFKGTDGGRDAGDGG